MTPWQIIGLVTGICAAGAVWIGWLALNAPFGWEDSEGWHEGIEPLNDPDNWGAQ